MNYTTVEQSKKLLELGLKPESADMYYEILTGDKYPQLVRLKLTDKHWMQLYLDVMMPCWSLGALLEVMPMSIEEVKDHKVDLILGHPKDKWCLAYFDWTGLQQGHSTTGDNPLEAAFEMVCWLLENNYINKGK